MWEDPTGVKIMKLLLMQFYPASFYLLPFRTKSLSNQQANIHFSMDKGMRIMNQVQVFLCIRDSYLHVFCAYKHLYTQQETVHQTTKEPSLILEKDINTGYSSFT
jgi:hypothetical protein